jgi:hypothetical protein
VVLLNSAQTYLHAAPACILDVLLEEAVCAW